MSELREDVNYIEGLGAIEDQEEFLGKIKANAKRTRNAMRNTAKAAKNAGKAKSVKVNVPATAASASGKEMAAMVSMLNPELQEALKKGTKKLADAAIYVVKSVKDAKNVKMFEDSDDKQIGVSNISKAKLEKNEVLCLSAIQVLYGVGETANLTPENVATIDWGELPSEIQNGEFTFRSSSTTLLDHLSNQIFKNHKVSEIQASSANVGGVAFGQGEVGFYKLANPSLISTQEAIDMFVEWGKTISANGFIKVVLYGTKIMNA